MPEEGGLRALMRAQARVDAANSDKRAACSAVLEVSAAELAKMLAALWEGGQRPGGHYTSNTWSKALVDECGCVVMDGSKVAGVRVTQSYLLGDRLAPIYVYQMVTRVYDPASVARARDDVAAGAPVSEHDHICHTPNCAGFNGHVKVELAWIHKFRERDQHRFKRIAAAARALRDGAADGAVVEAKLAEAVCTCNGTGGARDPPCIFPGIEYGVGA